MLAAFVAVRIAGAQAPRAADVVRDYEAQIRRLDAADPRAPQALQTHLRYADFLTRLGDAPCGERLARARQHLDTVQGNAALAIVVPQGLARSADIEYRLHSALAACHTSNGAQRAAELRAALDAAERAARLYEESFDYPAMLTERYNAAVTQRALGDTDAAVAALENVIAADRQYGFGDDATENAALLARWAPASAAQTMQEPPQRAVTLTFGWQPGERRVEFKASAVRILGDAMARTLGERTLTLRTVKSAHGWQVTYRPLSARYSLDPPSVGANLMPSLMEAICGMMLTFPDIRLENRKNAAEGSDFKEVVARDSFESGVQEAVRAAAMGPALETAMKGLLAHATFESNAAVEFNLQTGAWPDATLNQGQWYGMQMQLPLPFAPQNFVDYEVQFAFTRELPCGAEAKLQCVELVLRAVPVQQQLDAIAADISRALHLPAGDSISAWSTTSVRLVTDPDTLQIYARDLAQQFYVSRKRRPADALLGADQSHIEFETAESPQP